MPLAPLRGCGRPTPCLSPTLLAGEHWQCPEADPEGVQLGQRQPVGRSYEAVCHAEAGLVWEGPLDAPRLVVQLPQLLQG